jgi:hypothetical protein
MSRWTTDDLYEAYSNSEQFEGRIHLRRNLHIRGISGHMYILTVTRQPSYAVLAQISRNSGNAEVNLTRINDTFMINIGSVSMATATVFNPTIQDGIEEFRWIAHTHPLEQADSYEGVSWGATEADRVALRAIFQRWRQTESDVVVCRNGRVERTSTFRISDDTSLLDRRDLLERLHSLTE